MLNIGNSYSGFFRVTGEKLSLLMYHSPGMLVYLKISLRSFFSTEWKESLDELRCRSLWLASKIR